MAVIEALPGVTIEVVVNGQALHEYEDEDDAKTPSQSASYVEAQSGTPFEVRVHVKRGTYCLGNRLSLEVYVDGRYIDKTALNSFLFEKADVTKSFYPRSLAGGNVQIPCFADLTTTDDIDADQMSSAAQVTNLGVIEVKVYHKLWTAEMARMAGKAVTHRPLAPAPFAAVHEKILKGQSTSHSTELRTVSMGPQRKRMPCSTLHVDPSGKPAATYIFHYRSRVSLQSMLLIPQMPSRILMKVQASQKGGANDDLKELKREHANTFPLRRKVHRNNRITTVELDDNGNTIRETVQVRSATPTLSGTVTLD